MTEITQNNISYYMKYNYIRVLYKKLTLDLLLLIKFEFLISILFLNQEYSLVSILSLSIKLYIFIKQTS